MDRRVSYSGFLARLHGDRLPHSVFCTARGVSNVEVLRDRRWHSFEWKSRVPIAMERGRDEKFPYGPHQFILRGSGDRFILISRHQEVVQAFFRECRLNDYIEYPRIHLSHLVTHMLQPGEDAGRDYRVSQMFASVEGYGRSLRTMALWGDDIVSAELFRELQARTAPFRVSLKSVRTDKEIAGIGSGGELSLYFRGVNHLEQIDRLLKFLTEMKFISWSVIP